MTQVIGIKEATRHVADATGLHLIPSRAAISALVEYVAAEAAAGNKVRIPGLGTFALKSTPARTGRNPKTGEPVEIPAKQTLKFTASKAKAKE